MSNNKQIQVFTKGAELASIVANGREYLWQGDPVFWGRRAPILFPIVGKLANNTLRIDGKAYTMNQHGFARDAEFVQSQFNVNYNPLTGFRIIPSDEPLFLQMVKDGPIANYPYDFNLKVRYAVYGNSLDIDWEVENRGERPMYFQIGAHPAFMLPNYNPDDMIHGYLCCYNNEGQTVLPISSSHLEDGLRVISESRELANKRGLIPITNNTFANDAILLDSGNIKSVGLVDLQKKEILRISCPRAEVFGLWAPNKPGCPFVCIEPWCGVADRKGFNGDISEKDFIHSLAPNEMYVFSYSITINN